MEKDRTRGLKHIQDKKKYKGNTTKNPKYVPPKLLPNLDTNWDRYNREDDASTTLNSSTDFSILASAPILSGHHFQFKSDKVLAEETEQKASSQDLFCLDLAMIQNSILTVPFYERIGMDEKYFTDAQLRFMNSEAENNRKKYNENLEASIKQLKLDNRGDQLGSSTTKCVKDTSKIDVSVENVHSESSKVEKQPECGDFGKNKFDDDLEGWLDEILDE